MLDGRIVYAGDFYGANNPLRTSFLESKCDVVGGYTDQVFFTGPDDEPDRWRVDMSRYVKLVTKP
jgi:hypothetical protein